MKKLSLVLAVAAALPVLAHADVTISGTLAAGVDTIKYAGTGGWGTDPKLVTTTRTTGVDDFGSEIVFKGTEDLGNGLQTVWKVSNGFNSDGVANASGSGLGTFADRETFVGLKSASWGELRMGKLNDVLLETESTDNLYGPRRDAAATGSGNVNTPLYEAGGTPGYGAFNFAADHRANNTIKYDMPEWNGVTGQLQYSAGEKVTNGKQVGTLYGFHFNYNNAPTNLFVGVAYEAAINTGGNQDKTSAYSRIEGGYNGDNLTVALTYGHDSMYGDTTGSNQFNTLYGLNNHDSHLSSNAWGSYIAYQIGNWKPQIEVSRRSSTTVDGQNLNTGATEASFELDYSLSKRTTLFAGYAQVTENDALKALQQDSTNKSSMTYAGMLHHF